VIEVMQEVDRKFKYVLKVLVLSQQPVSLCNLPWRMLLFQHIIQG